MKFLVIFALALASASAEIYQRNVFVPVLENEGRITNGYTATKGQFPYQVGLSLINDNGGYWCGGCIISHTCVVTAAHCVDGISSINVFLGSTQFAVAEVTHIVTNANVTIHPNWNPLNQRNDIAVIRIPYTTYSPNIQPVQLPAISESYSKYDGEYVIASGWGRTSDSSSGVSNKLQFASMPVIPNSKCVQTFGNVVTSCNICCATPGGVSTCNGDSGGPIVLESKNILIGLTSFGARAGCTLGHPAVFTRITCYLKWLISCTSNSY